MTRVPQKKFYPCKRLKLSNAPTVAECHHEIIQFDQEVLEFTHIFDMNALLSSQNLPLNMVLNQFQIIPDKRTQEYLLPTSLTVSSNGTLSNFSVISNGLAESYEHERDSGLLRNYHFDSMNLNMGHWIWSNSSPISQAENYQYEVVQEEHR